MRCNDFKVENVDFSMLVKMALVGNLIPIFGAGFSAGCQAANGIVPNGVRAKEDMTTLIMDKGDSHGLSKEMINELDFFNVADLFFERVKIKDRAEYFEAKYTDVKLPPHCVDFLTKVSWPYAYTINVDDAIEKNSDFREILPYHKIKRSVTNKRLLFKLHGDANHESEYMDENEDYIVFSQKQYIRAMNDDDNADIYKALIADYSEKNLIFIGCSLDNEIDLQNVFNASHMYAKETSRLVIRSKKPSIQEEMKLKNHGVNCVLITKNFEQFYISFVNEYLRQASEKNTNYKFINPNVIPVNDKKESIDLISGKKIFDDKRNEFKKSSLHVLRNAVSTAIETLKSSDMLLLKGRRFSGKTFALCSLIEQYKNHDTLYFQSSTFIDESVIETLMNKQRNSVFLFDSNSLSPEGYNIVSQCKDIIFANRNKVVIVSNSNDNFLLSKIEGEIIELSNEFNEEELNFNKRLADFHGLIRRNKTDTNIDYLYRIKNEQRIDVPLFQGKEIAFTPKEKAVLIALCSLDKLYFSDVIALGMHRNEFNQMCEHLSPLIEEIDVDFNEKDRHSSTKLVHNSKLALIDILSNFDFDDIANSIIYIIRKFKPDFSRKRLYIEVILFDTMNQIFIPLSNKNSRRNGGVNIPEIYERLQPYLSDDLHYWLQRAKSIYRTNSNYNDLSKAYSYAMKTYKDSRPKSRLYISAALTIALILCVMGDNSNDENKLNTYEEAIVFADEAVNSDFYRRNPRYLNTELPKGKNTGSEKRIIIACKYVLDNSNSESLKKKAADLKAYFNS